MKYRRLFIGLLAFALFVTLAEGVFADGLVQDPDRRIKTYVKVNTAPDSGAGTQQLVPASTITPDDRILGYQVCAIADANGTAGAAVGLYDHTATATATDTELFAEAEVGNYLPTVAVWFAYPKQVTDKLVIRMQGASVVTVFYEDVSTY